MYRFCLISLLLLVLSGNAGNNCFEPADADARGLCEQKILTLSCETLDFNVVNNQETWKEKHFEEKTDQCEAFLKSDAGYKALTGGQKKYLKAKVKCLADFQVKGGKCILHPVDIGGLNGQAAYKKCLEEQLPEAIVVDDKDKADIVNEDLGRFVMKPKLYKSSVTKEFGGKKIFVAELCYETAFNTFFKEKCTFLSKSLEVECWCFESYDYSNNPKEDCDGFDSPEVEDYVSVFLKQPSLNASSSEEITTPDELEEAMLDSFAQTGLLSKLPAGKAGCLVTQNDYRYFLNER